MRLKIKLPQFETITDNDKPVNWQYIKQTYKDYFIGNKMTLKERINMTLLNKSHVATMYTVFVVVYGLWLFDLDSTLKIETFIPNARLVLGSVAFLCVIIITIDCYFDFINIKKRAKAVLNQDNYCDNEDRL